MAQAGPMTRGDVKVEAVARCGGSGSYLGAAGARALSGHMHRYRSTATDLGLQRLSERHAMTVIKDTFVKFS